MRKHVLFFVHGMGVYVDKQGKPSNAWSQAAAKSFKAQYQKYAVAKRKSFDDTFEVVHINYDLEFHKLVTRWAEESAKVTGAGIPAAAPAQKLVKWLNGANDQEKFAWTHFSDVVLYKFFALMRQRVKISVANQFHAALAPNHEGAVSSWSVIAHSLGTIITHDVLHAMDSTTTNEAGISIMDPMVSSATVIAMLANVSKVMENDVDVYKSMVVPSSMVQNQSACFQYVSCNNKFDPFVRPVPFKPSGPQWALAESNQTFVDIPTENIHDTNVHSLDNYLVNPDVHITLIERMLGMGTISDAEKKKARDEFQNVSDTIVEQGVQKLLALAQDQDWFEMVGKYFALVEAANA